MTGMAARDPDPFDALVSAMRACRICRDAPLYGPPLPHEPRPVFQVSRTARICIASQAPGIRVHESGRPFNDASGVRLRQWLGMSDEEFYDPARVAIIPMGLCFPGWTPQGGDLPPRRECAPTWHSKLFAQLPQVTLLLAIGGYAQRWHFGAAAARGGVTQTVLQWRELYGADPSLKRYPLPHPSWHNNRWIKSHPWFEAELLPSLQADVRDALS